MTRSRGSATRSPSETTDDHGFTGRLPPADTDPVTEAEQRDLDQLYADFAAAGMTPLWTGPA